MPAARLFLDSSALVAGIASESGAARALLVLAEASEIAILVSEQVIAETERALARRLPGALPAYRPLLRATGLTILSDPEPAVVAANEGLIAHRADLPLLVAAMQTGVDYLVTFNRRHSLDDPDVAVKSGLRIGTPADALTWLRIRSIEGSD